LLDYSIFFEPSSNLLTISSNFSFNSFFGTAPLFIFLTENSESNSASNAISLVSCK
jgi:hypothetical protein